jgi:pyrroloquinoline quinone biosynthesis protein B
VPHVARRLAALAALLAASACASSARPDAAGANPAGPYLVVLGTAQDGGLPQIGAEHERARAAFEDPARRRFAASLLVADPRSGARWLIDATPDVREQLELARRHPSTRPLPDPAGPRPPLLDGVLLTHAHIGHYAGLVHFGREAYGARELPLHVSASMARFLEANGPWGLLVAERNVRLEVFEAGAPIRLAPDLGATPVPVPHRHEYTDTHGFELRGPRRAVLYVPDIDKWERWDERIEDRIARVDVALLDGTFFAEGEIPGRAMAEIPHPFIAESLERFAALPASERAKIVFIHLNHTNPAHDAGGAADRAIRAAGMRVARQGEVIEL